jgi:hypothetical protein
LQAAAWPPRPRPSRAQTIPAAAGSDGRGWASVYTAGDLPVVPAILIFKSPARRRRASQRAGTQRHGGRRRQRHCRGGTQRRQHLQDFLADRGLTGWARARVPGEEERRLGARAAVPGAAAGRVSGGRSQRRRGGSRQEPCAVTRDTGFHGDVSAVDIPAGRLSWSGGGRRGLTRVH